MNKKQPTLEKKSSKLQEILSKLQSARNYHDAWVEHGVERVNYYSEK